MDDTGILQQLLPSLGVFAPVAFLGFWLIRTQQKVIETKDARIEKLTDQLIAMGASTERVLAQLTSAVKGG